VAKFQTEMAELERELNADVAQMGHVMARYDRVMDQYEATGYATTTNH
jgi:hypothetical protein